MTAYKDLIKDFLFRTLENIDNYEGDYEETQRINSFLGMVVFLTSDYKKQKDNSILSIISKENTCLKDVVMSLYGDNLDTRVNAKYGKGVKDCFDVELIAMFFEDLRHALAHPVEGSIDNFKILPEDIAECYKNGKEVTPQIEGIKFTNDHMKNKDKQNFYIEMNIKTLNEFCTKLNCLYKSAQDNDKFNIRI